MPAQLPQGAAAPDFNAQDITGQSWHLYDLLNEGKVVLLEVSATWCQPCWAYHNGHDLQKYYLAHGPDGDDKARVFFVEGDPQTNPECLLGPSGCNSFTFGNWLNGTTYPYLDNAALSDSFDVAYYPTIYMICPNRKVYQVGQLSAEKLWERSLGCPVASGTNNAGIFNYDPGTELYEICDTLSVKPAFSIINLGANALTSASVSLTWNDDLQQSLYWTGNLPLYGEAFITFDSLELSGEGVLKTTISSINGGQGDDDYSNNVHNNSFTQAAAFNTQKIILKIKTDNFGAETYWELLDEWGSVLYHGGNENVGPNGGGTYGEVDPGAGSYASNALINKTLELPGFGCYSIRFVDAYGDGICCNYGNGYYRLYGYNNPAVPILTGGEFEAIDHRGFVLSDPSAATTPEEQITDFRVFPNPAGNILNAAYNLQISAPVTLQIANTLGQVVYTVETEQVPAGDHEMAIPLGNLPGGIYFIRLEAGQRVFSRTFLKEN